MKILSLGHVEECSDDTIKALFSGATNLIDKHIHDYANNVSHYFPASALQSILSGQSLIFSDAEFLNDIEENSNIFVVLSQMLERELIDLDMSPMLANDIRDYAHIKSLLASDIIFKEPQNAIKDYKSADILSYLERRYLLCTSKDNDCLAMWKYYSKGSGYDAYNIVFSPMDFIECIRENFSCVDNGVRIMHGSIIYDDSVKKAILKQIITSIDGLYKEHLEDAAFSFRIELKIRFFNLLNDYGLFFKNEAYKHEQEYRFLIKLDNLNIKKHCLDYGFRSVGLYQIPFLKLKFKKELVKVLVTNPTISNNDLAIKGLGALLDFLEYTDSSIGISTIPLRY